MSKIAKNYIVPQRTLYDVRDQESYTVRKLADGNVWMTENLRLEFDGTSATGLTAENTNITSAQYNYDSNSDGVNDMLVIAETQSRNGATSSTEISDWAGSGEVNQQNLDRWLSRSLKVNGVWATETNPSISGLPDDRKQNKTGENQKFGVKYNIYTATAGAGWFDIRNQVVAEDICPFGWKLPEDLRPLIKSVYGIVTTDLSWGAESEIAVLQNYPFTIPFSGTISGANGTTGGQGNVANITYSYLTSARDRKYLFIGLSYNGWLISSWEGDSRNNGVSIRCVIK